MIILDNVTKQYSDTIALDHLTAKLSKDKIYCLLGSNGAGKTTMLKLIAGHINASSGTVQVEHKPVSTLKMPECVNFIENRTSQFNTNAGNLIKMASALNDQFDQEFALGMVEKFQLNIRKKYSQLSFGMQTMFTTLLSLASKTKVVLLDEPVLGFDAIMRSKFYDLLNDSFENHPRIIIVSTHLIDEIAKSAEDLIILNKGKLIFQSSINDIDEKAFSITGLTKDVTPVLEGLNVIGQKMIGGHTTAFIYDERKGIPASLTVQPIGLQDFFVNIVGGDTDED